MYLVCMQAGYSAARHHQFFCQHLFNPTVTTDRLSASYNEHCADVLHLCNFGLRTSTEFGASIQPFHNSPFKIKLSKTTTNPAKPFALLTSAFLQMNRSTCSKSHRSMVVHGGRVWEHATLYNGATWWCSQLQVAYKLTNSVHQRHKYCKTCIAISNLWAAMPCEIRVRFNTWTRQTA